MTRNGFMTLKDMMHFCETDNFENNKNDRDYKVRPLIGIFEKDLSFNKMIVKQYGHKSVKQNIK